MAEREERGHDEGRGAEEKAGGRGSKKGSVGVGEQVPGVPPSIQ